MEKKVFGQKREYVILAFLYIKKHFWVLLVLKEKKTNNSHGNKKRNHDNHDHDYINQTRMMMLYLFETIFGHIQID